MEGITFREKCEKAGVNPNVAYSYRKLHPDMGDEQLIKELLERRDKLKQQKEIRKFCIEMQITTDTFYMYLNRHPELSIEQVMHYYKNRNTIRKEERVLNENVTEQDIEGMTLTKMCELVGIDYTSVSAYRKTHPELTYAQATIIVRDKKLAKIKSIQGKLKEKRINTDGIEMRIIEYNNSNNITVQFSDGVVKYNCDYTNFKNGRISHPSKELSKFIGQYRMMNCGIGATILDIDYNTDKVRIRFDDGLIMMANRNNFFKGTVKHPDYNTKVNKSREEGKKLIGEKNITKYGETIEIIDARTTNEILIRFDNGIERWTTYKHFKDGTPQSKKHVTKKDTYTFKNYCNDRNLTNYTSLVGFANKYLGGVAKLSSIEEYDNVVKKYNESKFKKSFADKLKEAGLITDIHDKRYNTLKEARRKSVLTDDELIKMYVEKFNNSNDTYINILGQLVTMC